MTESNAVVKRAWLGLGSNLNEPAAQLQKALARLENHAQMQLLQASRFYRTTPVGGPPGQPLFCNAAAVVRTTLMPKALLQALQAIEAAHERVRDVRWGPRTLDLDILACDNIVMNEPDLQMPHPRAHERAFVLQPLSELAPDLQLGDRGSVADCLKKVDGQGVTLWDSA